MYNEMPIKLGATIERLSIGANIRKLHIMKFNCGNLGVSEIKITTLCTHIK